MAEDTVTQEVAFRMHTPKGLGVPGCTCKGNPATSLAVSPHSLQGVGKHEWACWGGVNTQLGVQPVPKTPGSGPHSLGSDPRCSSSKVCHLTLSFPYRIVD
jgi:hypothetical protein